MFRHVYEIAFIILLYTSQKFAASLISMSGLPRDVAALICRGCYRVWSREATFLPPRDVAMCHDNKCFDIPTVGSPYHIALHVGARYINRLDRLSAFITLRTTISLITFYKSDKKQCVFFLYSRVVIRKNNI